jgi:hypothetical protein
MSANRTLRSLFLAAVLVNGVSAQAAVLDQGAFRLTLAGRDVGTETFSIKQNGTGDNAVVLASGKVVLDTARAGEELSALLQVSGATLRPAAYQVTVSGANNQEIAGRVVGSRFSAKILSSAGEEMREYLAGEGAVVVDEGVAHHYYFLAKRVSTESAQVPIIIPRRNQQVMARVSSRGTESVTVGGAQLQARRLVVTTPGTPDRHVWVDDQGRVLRLEIPARSYVAARQAAPK